MLKLVTVGADFITVQRLFHTFDPRNEKPSWPLAVSSFWDLKVSSSVTKLVRMNFDISNKQVVEVMWSKPID